MIRKKTEDSVPEPADALKETLALESEETLVKPDCREIIDAAPEIILVFNRKGIITFANQGAFDIVGYLPEELMGMDISDILQPDDYKAVKALFFNPFRTLSKNLHQREVMFIDRELELIPVEINVQAFPSAGDAAHVLFIGRDIRQRKAREKERWRGRTLKYLRKAVGGVTDGLTELFSDILSDIDFVLEHADLQTTVFRRLSAAGIGCRSAREQVQYYSDIFNPSPQTFHQVKIVRILRKVAASVAGEYQTACDFDPPEDLWTVACDESQIAAVFRQLLLNAVQADPEGGPIRMDTENLPPETAVGKQLPRKKFVRITIGNSGKGIPEADLERVFDPFFTTHEDRPGRIPRGLGLTQAHIIVRRHDGFMRMRSRPGRRTEVTVYLPVVIQEAEVMDQRIDMNMGEEKGFRLKGRILLMDDEAVVRESAGEMIRSMGYQVGVAGDGVEAVALYMAAMSAGDPYDAVLLDLNVEDGMDGKAAMKELKELDPDVKAVAASGYSGDPEMKEFRRHGFCAMAGKPYDGVELGQILERLLDV